MKAIAASQQVKEYLKTYGIVLVTNLREFLIVERGPNGQPVERESFALADDERDFWQHKAAHPRGTAKQKGEQFIEFIKRCLPSRRAADQSRKTWRGFWHPTPAMPFSASSNRRNCRPCKPSAPPWKKPWA